MAVQQRRARSLRCRLEHEQASAASRGGDFSSGLRSPRASDGLTNRSLPRHRQHRRSGLRVRDDVLATLFFGQRRQALSTLLSSALRSLLCVDTGFEATALGQRRQRLSPGRWVSPSSFSIPHAPQRRGFQCVSRHFTSRLCPSTLPNRYRAGRHALHSPAVAVRQVHVSLSRFHLFKCSCWRSPLGPSLHCLGLFLGALAGLLRRAWVSSVPVDA